jgi:signal transduction histidine kinase
MLFAFSVLEDVRVNPAVRPIDVLVAHHDRTSEERFARMLRGAGFAPRIRTATADVEVSGASAGEVDVVIAEYELPGGGGLALLRAIRERGIDVPVIVVGRLARGDEGVECVRAGAVDYVSEDRLWRLPTSVGHALLARELERERRRNERAEIEFGRLLREREAQVEELGALRDSALEASRVKSIFLATMSHEVRTPLNVILGYAAIIDDRLTEEGEEWSAPLVAAMRRGGDRLLTTVTRILEISRLEGGELTTRPKRIDLARLLDEELDGYALQARAKGLGFRVERSGEEIGVEADVHCLTHALRNILENAVKFTEQGEIVARILEDGRGTARIEVRDTGIGIGAAFLPHLFELFSQEDAGYTRKFEGTGLGLALARRYVEKTGGRLSVETEKGRGSTFTISLPVAAPIAAEATDAVRQAVHRAVHLQETP